MTVHNVFSNNAKHHHAVTERQQLSRTLQLDSTNHFSYRIIKDKYGMLKMGIINKGSASALDIYESQSYLSFGIYNKKKKLLTKLQDNLRITPFLL